MLILRLAVLLTSVLAADLSTEQLIGRLSSPDRVVREEAARTLEERGTDVLPALRAARDAADDAEARGRLADLIARVEAGRLDRPTMVTLDCDNCPLGEAVEALAKRSGFAIVLDDPALAARQVTVRAPAPLPFWEALDRLGRAAHVRHEPGRPRLVVGDQSDPSTIHLIDGDPPAFTTYSGPLRVHLFATHRHRDISFEPNVERRAKGSVTTVTVEVQAFAEPGRFLDPAGPPRIEVVDPGGQAPAPSPGDGDWPDPARRMSRTPGELPLLHWHVPIGVTDVPGRPPLKLRGVLPVIISVRRPDPLVIPLADAAGKTFRQDGIVVRIEALSGPGGSPGTTLILSQEQDDPGRGRASLGPQADRVTELVHHRLEFEDAEGRRLWWQIAFRPLPDANDELRVQVILRGRVPAARLRVYRLNRLATELPFAFDDVPAP